MMDRALVVRRRACDIAPLGPVVEALRLHVREMAETVPLRPALGIHVVDIIVGDVLREHFDLVLEDLAVERWLLWHIQG